MGIELSDTERRDAEQFADGEAMRKQLIFDLSFIHSSVGLIDPDYDRVILAYRRVKDHLQRVKLP